jgi:hypothetical protein
MLPRRAIQVAIWPAPAKLVRAGCVVGDPHFAPDKFAAPHDEAPRNIVAMGQPVTVMFSFGLHGSALNKRHVHHAAQY